MNRVTALELLKDKAPSKYHGTALVMLGQLVRACFGPDAPRECTFKADTLMRRVGIGSKQLGLHLDRFTGDGVGVFVRKDGKVRVTKLDLSKLAALPKPIKKDHKEGRARKARETYARMRREQLSAVSGFLLAAGVLCGAGVPSSEVFPTCSEVFPTCSPITASVSNVSPPEILES